MQPPVVLVGVLGAEYCTFERTVLNQFYAYYKSLVEVDFEEEEQTARAERRRHTACKQTEISRKIGKLGKPSKLRLYRRKLRAEFAAALYGGCMEPLVPVLIAKCY